MMRDHYKDMLDGIVTKFERAWQSCEKESASIKVAGVTVDPNGDVVLKTPTGYIKRTTSCGAWAEIFKDNSGRGMEVDGTRTIFDINATGLNRSVALRPEGTVVLKLDGTTTMLTPDGMRIASQIESICVS